MILQILFLYLIFYCPFQQILSCAVNAGCLAMINSGIDMQYLVVAVTACISSEGDIIIDPCEPELRVSNS